MPQADPIVKSPTVRLVDDSYPTPKRKKVAEYIDENWNENNGIALTEIAQELGVSRQHVKNTLEDHFEIAENDNGETVADHNFDSNVLELILEAYRRGYRDGRQDEKDVKLNGDLDQLLGQLAK